MAGKHVVMPLTTTEEPSLILGQGWAVYRGRIEPGRVHRHHAAQIGWTAPGMVSLEGAWGALDSPGHVLPPGVSHRLVASHAMRMVFVDAHGVGSRVLRKLSTAVALSQSQVALLESELEPGLVAARLSTEAALTHEQGERRWRHVLDWLDENLERSVRAGEAAAAIGISASRFMHWFANASGLPFRAYVRWLRLQRAVLTLADGSSLTEAAHFAGFSDSAHLTRTFVATFGVRPMLLRETQIECVRSSCPPAWSTVLTIIEGPSRAG